VEVNDVVAALAAKAANAVTAIHCVIFIMSLSLLVPATASAATGHG
jgi:hypothetical protein